MPSSVGLTLVELWTARAAMPSLGLLAAPTAGPTDLPAARAAMPPLDPSERAVSGALSFLWYSLAYQFGNMLNGYSRSDATI
jgi:hypothetical protein